MNFLSTSGVDVQVWLLNLSTPERTGWLRRGYEILSADEVDRAARLRAGTPRDEFVAARAALRLLLGAKLGLAPEMLQFSVGPHGKPQLAAENASLHFNVAHSRGAILVAISSAGPVGVDIERVDRSLEVLDIARSTFHPDEVAALESLEECERSAEFFRFWTAKEAVMKADGRGLIIDLHTFSVSSHGLGELRVSVPMNETRSRKGQLSQQSVETSSNEQPPEYYVQLLPVGLQFAAAIAGTQRAQSLPVNDFSLFFQRECHTRFPALPLAQPFAGKVTSSHY